MANTQHRLGHNYSGLAAADSSHFQAGDINSKRPSWSWYSDTTNAMALQIARSTIITHPVLKTQINVFVICS